MSTKKDFDFQNLDSVSHTFTRTSKGNSEMDNFIEYINTSIHLIDKNSPSGADVQTNNLLYMIVKNGLKYANDICNQK